MIIGNQLYSQLTTLYCDSCEFNFRGLLVEKTDSIISIIYDNQSIQNLIEPDYIYTKSYAKVMIYKDKFSLHANKNELIEIYLANNNDYVIIKKATFNEFDSSCFVKLDSAEINHNDTLQYENLTLRFCKGTSRIVIDYEAIHGEFIKSTVSKNKFQLEFHFLIEDNWVLKNSNLNKRKQQFNALDFFAHSKVKVNKRKIKLVYFEYTQPESIVCTQKFIIHK
jgi:hypothetical protein